VREQRYPRGALIVRQGDPGDALYIVRSGAVKVAVVGVDGREVILGTLGPTEHFGELALIDGSRGRATSVATESTALFVLRRDEFRAEVERMPRVAWALLEELSRRLRDAGREDHGLVLLDVPAAWRASSSTAAQGDPPTVQKAPTHEMIAQMIGRSRETVSRAMKELSETGLIQAERRRHHHPRPRGAREARRARCGCAAPGRPLPRSAARPCCARTPPAPAARGRGGVGRRRRRCRRR
jgi:CRP/FNR family cyclic AMP-dependent transcriptional regulator